jgi:hypothetical protein
LHADASVVLAFFDGLQPIVVARDQLFDIDWGDSGQRGRLRQLLNDAAT